MRSPMIGPSGRVWQDVDEVRVARWITPWDWKEDADACIIGAPFTSGNTKPTGSWAAPDAVRAALTDFTTYSADYDVDLAALDVRDAGDILVAGADPAESLLRIEEAVAAIVQRRRNPIPIIIGGDHSITAPAVRGFGRKQEPSGQVGLIYFDSHTDVRAPQEGGALAGSPVRSILETASHVQGRNVIEIGLHGFMNATAHKRWAEERGITLVSAREVRKRGVDEVVSQALEIAASGTDSIYVSIDLDVLGQTHSVGAAGRISPEGMEAVDLIEAAFLLGGDIRVQAFDVVELDPLKDVRGITTRVAVSLVLTFLGGLLGRAGTAATR